MKTRQQENQPWELCPFYPRHILSVATGVQRSLQELFTRVPPRHTQSYPSHRTMHLNSHGFLTLSHFCDVSGGETHILWKYVETNPETRIVTVLAAHHIYIQDIGEITSLSIANS